MHIFNFLRGAPKRNKVFPVKSFNSPKRGNSPLSLKEKIGNIWGTTPDSDGKKILDMLTQLNIKDNTIYRDVGRLEVIILNGKEKEEEIKDAINKINESKHQSMRQQLSGPSTLMTAVTINNDVFLIRSSFKFQ